MGRKLEVCAPLGEGELGHHLTQCGQGRGLPACQVSSWSVQPFGHSARTSQTDRTDRQDRQRTDSIGRTVAQKGPPPPPKKKNWSRLIFAIADRDRLPAVPSEMQKQKCHPFTQMLYCCNARLQPVAGLIYSVLLLATHAHATVWFPKSRSQWISALECYAAIAQEKGSWAFCTATFGLCWT